MCNRRTIFMWLKNLRVDFKVVMTNSPPKGKLIQQPFWTNLVRSRFPTREIFKPLCYFYIIFSLSSFFDCVCKCSSLSFVASYLSLFSWFFHLSNGGGYKVFTIGQISLGTGETWYLRTAVIASVRFFKKGLKDIVSFFFNTQYANELGSIGKPSYSFEQS